MTKTVLIVEDEPSLLSMLVRRVESLGYQTVQAIDGVEALEQIQKHMPDLILLDIIMPKKNGLDVLQELRVRLKSQVPVIVLSNLDRDDDIQAAKSYDIASYMIKSDITVRELSRNIAATIG